MPFHRKSEKNSVSDNFFALYQGIFFVINFFQRKIITTFAAYFRTQSLAANNWTLFTLRSSNM